MTRTLAFLTAVALIGVSGAVAGYWTNRWVPSRPVQEAADRLQAVPQKLGEWDGTDMPLEDRAVAQADIAGYLHRKYVHRRTGAAVTVLVVCGRAGPVCVHTPEVCYVNSGWAQTVTSRFKAPVASEKDAPADFSVMEFRHQNDALPRQIRLFLAWGTKDRWSAPAQPRLVFARESMLYKIYVIREVPRLTDTVEQDPSSDLIQALMPALHPTLFPQA